MEKNIEKYNDMNKEKNVWERDNSFVVVMIIYIVVMLLLVGLRVLGALGIIDHVGFNIAAQIGVMLLVPFIAIKIFSKQSWKKTAINFGFGKTTRKVIGLAFVLGVLIYVLNLFVASVFHMIIATFDYKFIGGGGGMMTVDTGITALLISILMIGVLPGVCEEVTHRGMLLQSLRARMGVMRAVLISSIMFGFMHMNILQVFFTTILGFLIALAVVATRSIWTGVIMHFMNNGLDTYLRFADQNGWILAGSRQELFGLFAGPMGFFIMIAFFYCVYLVIMKIILYFAKENYQKDAKLNFAKFVQSNPDIVAERIKQGQSVTMEDMSGKADEHVKRLGKFEALKFYLGDDSATKKPLTAMEKTLLFGILFFGLVITGMTFYWGII